MPVVFEEAHSDCRVLTLLNLPRKYRPALGTLAERMSLPQYDWSEKCLSTSLKPGIAGRLLRTPSSNIEVQVRKNASMDTVERGAILDTEEERRRAKSDIEKGSDHEAQASTTRKFCHVP
jgi:hypothetical protein